MQLVEIRRHMGFMISVVSDEEVSLMVGEVLREEEHSIFILIYAMSV